MSSSKKVTKGGQPEPPPQRETLSRLEALSLVAYLGGTLIIGIKISWLWSLMAVAIFVAMVLLRYPALDTIRLLFDQLRWVIIVVVWFIAYLVADDYRPTYEFFSICAQVIPVLLLALALEARMFEGFHDKGDLLTALIIVYVLGAGEFVALDVIGAGAEAPIERGDGPIVVGAIAAGFTGVVVGALAAPGTHVKALS